MPQRNNFPELKRVFKILHSPGGCPWDRKQTRKSLIPQLREEVDEYITAVRRNDRENMKEELGDILLHIMFSAQIAAKDGDFTVEDVIEGLVSKLKRRHPHVFGSKKTLTARQVIANWHKIKAQEKKARP